MPLRSPPKIHHLMLKTHKLTIFLTLPPNTTIAQVKEEALSALVSDVNQAHTEIDGTPTVSSVDDFELGRTTRDGERQAAGITPSYEILDTRRSLREYGFTSWATLFFMFKSEDGELLPVVATIPSIDDEDVEMQQPPRDAMSDDTPPVPSVNKGKRKAPPEDSD